MITANFSAYSTYVTDSLFQWDQNRVLRVTGLNLKVKPEVHFSNANMRGAIPVQADLVNHVVVASIPNSLLQEPLRIYAHIGIYDGDEFKVVELVEIPVKPRKRPADYELAVDDFELYSFKRLENMLGSKADSAEAKALNVRIDNIVANANNTEGNSELVDIRVGAHGESYASAGSAVRWQAINTDRLRANFGYVWQSGYIDANGVIVAPAVGRYYSEHILVNPGEVINYIAETNHENVAGISFYDENHNFLSCHCNTGNMGETQTVTADPTARYCRLSIKEGQQSMAFAASESDAVSSAIVDIDAALKHSDFDRNQATKCAKLYRKLQAINAKNGKVTAVGDSLTEADDYDEQIMSHFPRVTLVDKGIGGNTTLDIINRLDDIVASAPDLYLLAVGVNDNRYNDGRGAKTEAEYIANMTTIIDRLRTSADVVVVGIWRTFHSDQYAALGIDATRKRADRWNAALEKLCDGREVLFINPNHDIDKVINLESESRFCADGVHTNDAGNKMRADAVLYGNLDPKVYDATAFEASGKYCYLLEILGTNDSSGYVMLNNIHVAPARIAGESFTNSANVNYRDLETMFNGGGDYLGVANKAYDFPLYITWASDLPVASVVYSAKASGREIVGYNLYVSTDKRAVVDPYHKSWRLLKSGADHDPANMRLY